MRVLFGILGSDNWKARNIFKKYNFCQAQLQLELRLALYLTFQTHPQWQRMDTHTFFDVTYKRIKLYIEAACCLKILWYFYVLLNFLFYILVKYLFCQICFADISAPKYRSGMVMYSKRIYVYQFSEHPRPISSWILVLETFKEGVSLRDLFAVLKMGDFGPLIWNTYFGFHEGSFWYTGFQ